MRLRAVFVPLFVACTLCIPAGASQPEGLVGKLIGNQNVTVKLGALPLCTITSFEWYEYFGSYQLDPAKTGSVNLALIPFRTGPTYLGLDESERGTTFVNIMFSDGLVNGIPYDRSGWNDVVVMLRPATQDYTITINGVTGGPFPYDACQELGGCFSIKALRLFATSSGDNAVAWLDSVLILEEAAAGHRRLYGLDFDGCSSPPDVAWGGLLVSEPPRRPARVRTSSGG